MAAPAWATITFQVGAKKAKIGHGLDQFTRETAFTVAFFNDRDEIFFNKAARGVTHQTLVVGEQGIKLDEIHALELKNGHILLFWMGRCIAGQAGTDIARTTRSGQTFKASRGNGQGQTPKSPGNPAGLREHFLSDFAHRTALVNDDEIF